MNKRYPENAGRNDRNISVEAPEIRTAEALSDWLDRSLEDLVDQFKDFVTTNSDRTFFGR